MNNKAKYGGLVMKLIDERIDKWSLACLVLWSFNLSWDVEHHHAIWSTLDTLIMMWNVADLIKKENQ